MFLDLGIGAEVCFCTCLIYKCSDAIGSLFVRLPRHEKKNIYREREVGNGFLKPNV